MTRDKYEHKSNNLCILFHKNIFFFDYIKVLTLKKCCREFPSKQHMGIFKLFKHNLGLLITLVSAS